MKYGDDIWHAVPRTQYVKGFVGPKGRPVSITDEEARRLGVERAEANVRQELNVNVGDMVEIIEGSLASFVGVVKSIDEANHRLTCVVEMFGRESDVDLDFSQVRPSNK